jgi:hypothetical protein
MSNLQAVQELTVNVTKLNARDQKFANDLIAQFDARGLSEKQMYWVKELTNRANKVAPAPREQIDVGEFAKMIALFDNAAKKLKSPAVRLFNEEEGEIILNVAGEKARQPGTINVATPGGYGKGTWFGRVLKNGALEVSPRNKPSASLIALLTAFAADPAKVAAEYGKMMGRCCFCSKKLTDQRSTYVGYGPVCAENWHLPWGSPEDVTFQLLIGG